MALTEISPFETEPGRNSFRYVPSSPFAEYFDGEKPIPDVELELEERFSYERITGLTVQYLTEMLGPDWREEVKDRMFVGLLPASGPYKDLGAFVETVRFSGMFDRPKSQIYNEYNKYDSDSTFIVAIDSTLDEPFPIGSLRMIMPGGQDGFKSVSDFLGDKPKNPWLNEIYEAYFDNSEAYNPETAWQRIIAATGDTVNLNESIDVPTLAVLEEYASNGAADGTSIALYHSCMQYARAKGYLNVLSIQDLRPLAILQAFGEPFDAFPGVNPQINEGKFLTIPAYCIVERAVSRIRNANAEVGAMFVDGEVLNTQYMFPEEYDSTMVLTSAKSDVYLPPAA